MKREDFVLVMSFLLMLEGYLLGNVLPAALGLAILFYLLSVRSSTELRIDASVEFPQGPLESGRSYPLSLRLVNLGSSVRVLPRVMPRGLDVKIPEAFLKAGEARELKGTLRPLEMGVVGVDGITLIAEDERGLYVDEVPLEGATFKVYPSLTEIRDAAKIDRNLRLAELYRRGRRFGSESLEFKDLREYLPGDDVRRIDWKASLRLGELIVREFLREESSDVYIFLDNTREMRKGIRRAKVDYGATLVLQLASVLLRDHSVGLVVYDDVGARIVPARKGSDQLEAIRRGLEIKREEGAMSLRFPLSPTLSSKALDFLRKVLPLRRGRRGSKGIFEAFSLLKKPSFIILITDLNNPSDVYRAVASAKKLHRIIILSPNPVLFYSGKLDEETLEKLYRAYVEREELIKKFNALVPTIDLGPSDYLREIARVM